VYNKPGGNGVGAMVGGAGVVADVVPPPLVDVATLAVVVVVVVVIGISRHLHCLHVVAADPSKHPDSDLNASQPTPPTISTKITINNNARKNISNIIIIIIV
jgi:hypothetical protein